MAVALNMKTIGLLVALAFQLVAGVEDDLEENGSPPASSLQRTRPFGDLNGQRTAETGLKLTDIPRAVSLSGSLSSSRRESTDGIPAPRVDDLMKLPEADAVAAAAVPEQQQQPQLFSKYDSDYGFDCRSGILHASPDPTGALGYLQTLKPQGGRFSTGDKEFIERVASAHNVQIVVAGPGETFRNVLLKDVTIYIRILETGKLEIQIIDVRPRPK